MTISFPFIKRVALVLLHRVFTKYGPASTASDANSTVQLLFPRPYYGDVTRVGGNSDGAYVLPQSPLNGISASISPGVSEVIDFDLELGQLGIHSYLYDASVSCPTRLTNMQHFEKMYIDSFKSDNTKTLHQIVDEISEQHKGDLLLQMDIEGAEYRCIHATSSTTLKRFRIIVLEFHDLDFFLSNSLYCRYWIRPILQKLRTNHDVLHVHVNNHGHLTNVQGTPVSNVMEVTYLRHDHWSSQNSEVVDTRRLDIQNRSDRPPIVLNSPWFDYIDQT